jgi:putative transposase
MEKMFEDKIPAALRQQARKLAGCGLLEMGRNAIYSAFGLLMTVIEAASGAASIESKAKTADADTVFYHLGKLSVDAIEGMLKTNIGRAVKLAKRMFGGRKFAIAIDYTDEMFYGDESKAPVVGTKHKNGSSYAFKYLTVNIVVKNCRFFLFAYPVFERGDNWKYIEKTLDLLEEFGIKTHVLLLDREFNDSMTLELLQRRNHAYIIPADQDSKFERWKKSAEKFPAIFRGWNVAGVETDLVMLEGKGHVYGYLTNLPEEFYRDDAFALSGLYAKRWGIETAHRIEDKFRIYTTTRNGAIRYLFFAISVLLYNLWVWINMTFGLAGAAAIKVEEMIQMLRSMFDELRRWLKSPDRWFCRQLENFGRAAFALGSHALPRGSLSCRQKILSKIRSSGRFSGTGFNYFRKY